MSPDEIAFHLNGVLHADPLLVVFGPGVVGRPRAFAAEAEFSLLIDGGPEEAERVAAQLVEHAPTAGVRVFPITEAMTEALLAAEILAGYEVVRDMQRRWPLARAVMEGIAPAPDPEPSLA